MVYVIGMKFHKLKELDQMNEIKKIDFEFNRNRNIHIINDKLNEIIDYINKKIKEDEFNA